ncbi:neuropilin and tolloid-like protein 2 [Haliotis rufescens]|uniref:neuropilin and tolloid-like protein 2 n=1 Tax=Haliotis rufescens TaxID=6454 RepID=UPI00201F13A2|nr:neuropilin and tolloid-like protein 2 [Haliotis rufescens]
MMGVFRIGVVALVAVLVVVPGRLTLGGRVSQPMALRIAAPPMTFDNVSPKCWNFTYGNYQKMEFYSPGYPNKYTNDTDCVLYLEAPQNFKIQLDFRDVFKIEKSEKCKYDYLEVRDGPFAYSPLIQRFCGDDFPPLVTSTSRFLWMRFKSDDLIQDEGFKAIYSYIKDNTQNDGNVFSQAPAPVCREFLEVSPSKPDGVLSSSRLGHEITSYQVPRPYDCTWELHTDKTYGIYVRTHNMTMRRPQRCDQNYIALYKRTTLDKTKYVQYCAGPKAEMKTKENRVFVRLYGKTPSNRPEIEMVYTIYRHGVKVCSSGEFKCGEMCLPRSLLCNGIPNCPAEEDEVNCAGKEVASSGSALPLHAIVAGSIGGVLLTAVVIGVCVSCHYKRRDKRSDRELKKQQQKQRNALEMAVSNSSTTTYSLSRQGGPGAGSSPASHHPQLSPRSKDNTHRYSLGSSVQHSSEGDPADTMSDVGNYKRFLTMEMTPDEESSPCPSLYSQTGVVTVERHPALESPYPRFTSNAWRPEDPMHYPYTSLKKPPQFNVTKPFSYSPESKYITSIPSLKYTNNDIRPEN